MTMRTNVVLDEALIDEAMRLSQIKTKREVIALALSEFVAFRKRLDMRKLRGADLIRHDYDHKKTRAVRHVA
jgi:Arc/MetJ family transcription regulator